MKHRKNRVPKKGDRVAIRGEKGAFVVYDVDDRLECAELKQIGRELALSSIPWTKLTFLNAPRP
jgi:hypothetical protein